MDDETAQAICKILTAMGKDAHVGYMSKECQVTVYETVATIKDVVDFILYAARIKDE